MGTGEISMRKLSMAVGAVITPVDGSSPASRPAPLASNGVDAILAIGIVLATWAVALWAASYFSQMVS
jgi:hypothetical protein